MNSTVAGLFLEIGNLPFYNSAEMVEREFEPKEGYSGVVLGSERHWLDAFKRNEQLRAERPESNYPPSLRVSEGLHVVSHKILFVHHHAAPRGDDYDG